MTDDRRSDPEPFEYGDGAGSPGEGNDYADAFPERFTAPAPRVLGEQEPRSYAHTIARMIRDNPHFEVGSSIDADMLEAEAESLRTALASARAALDEKEDEIASKDYFAGRLVAERDALQSALTEAGRREEQYREALERIAKGEGRFSMDPLTHAENTIADAVATAKSALAARASRSDGQPGDGNG